MSLGDLALIVAAGLAGPLLAASRRAFVPVVVGEILAGVVLGRSGLDVVDADNATVSFLAEAGFAMLMLTVGMHVPLRDRRLRRALGRGALAAGVAAIAAPLGGLVVAELTGTGHIAVYAVLLASGSAAIVLPTLQERKLDGPEALVVIAQVTVADVAAILAVPLVLQPSRAADAVVGGLLVAGVRPDRLPRRPITAPAALGPPSAKALQATRLGAGSAPLAGRALRPGVDRAGARHQRAPRRIRHGPRRGRASEGPSACRRRSAASRKASSSRSSSSCSERVWTSARWSTTPICCS